MEARCGETCTPASAGGLGKRYGGNAVTAPRADPTGDTPAAGTSTPVIVDLTQLRNGLGPARLLDMVDGRSKEVFTA